ncbi:MAG: M1 family metallopeptidase [Theionarchaea archaeon]|nr:M1 family metallopeptidase [Theionarchaea archaeon]
MKKSIVIVLILVLMKGCITQSPETPFPEKDNSLVSSLFETWDDHTLFRKGLIQSEWGAIDLLSVAPVYHIDVHISDDCLFLQGHEEVSYTNCEPVPLQHVYFRLFPHISGGAITVSSVKVDSQDVDLAYEFEGSALRISLPEELQPDKNVIIEMDFTVEVAQDMGGNYGLFGYFDNILVLDGFYPVIPVYDDEGWNVEVPPSHGDLMYCDASFYLVRVTAPSTLKVVTSGIEIGSKKDRDTQVLAFAAGPARDFYLAASENYTVVSSQIGETTINSYALPERKDRAEMALKTAENALKSFNERFGIYPYTEFDIVSTPMLAKGMEYSGIVAISQRLYDPDEVISGLPSHIFLESVTAHETAHQWFYNIVGNDQVDEPWLDESLAQYLTGLYYTDVYGEAAAEDYRNSWYDLWESVNRQDILIGLPSREYTDEQYSPIIYGRGPLFLMALAEEMGQELFDAFMRDYYESHRWGISTTDSFRHLAEYYCHCDLSYLFEEWIAYSRYILAHIEVALTFRS